jgi:L-malate glycosyltransferase
MTDKIRIAYLIDTISSNKAGTEKQLLQILERLDRDRFEPTLICLYQSPFMREYRFPCDTVSLGYRGFFHPAFLLVLWRYLRVLKKERFQIVQTFFEDSIFVGFLGRALSRCRHALVVSRRDLGLGADEPGNHRFYKKVMPALLRSATGISTNAQAIKDHTQRHAGVAAAKIQVIANGLELPSVPGETPALFRDYPDVLWIGLVANLKPIKRVDLFIRALASLNECESGRQVHGVILGEGRLRPELSGLAEELGVAGRIHLVGAADNVTDYLQHIDIGVLCSDKEGLSNALLEYMACGLPAVVTDVGGNSELVDDSNGICVPAGDHLALGRALGRLAASESLRKELGARSRNKVCSTSTWEIIMPQWEQYYSRLASQVVGEC